MDANNNISLPCMLKPGDTPTVELLYALARTGNPDWQARIHIALYLAGRGQGVFELQPLRDCARAAGTNGAEMIANEAGSSHDLKGTACLRFVRVLLDEPGSPSRRDLDAVATVGYRPANIAEMMAQVSINTLLADQNGPLASADILDCERLRTPAR